MVVTHLFKIFCNLNLDLIGYGFFIFNNCKQFGEFAVVFLIEKLTHFCKHLLNENTESGCLFLCLQHCDFRCLHESVADVTQSDGFFFSFRLIFDSPAHYFLDLRDKSDEDGGVGNIEAGVEHSEHHAQFSRVGYALFISHEGAYHIDERM